MPVRPWIRGAGASAGRLRQTRTMLEATELPGAFGKWPVIGGGIIEGQAKTLGLHLKTGAIAGEKRLFAPWWAWSVSAIQSSEIPINFKPLDPP